MKAVNLFLLSREVPEAVHQDFECALSGRGKPVRYRCEEIELIREIIKTFTQYNAPQDFYDGWFYSFTIPQVGKEFDLLRITENSVLNLELKSRPVDVSKVEKQLIQNRYYLGHLKKEIYSFALVRDADGSLVLYRYEPDTVRSRAAEGCTTGIRTDSVRYGHAFTEVNGIESGSFRELLDILSSQTSCFTDNIEALFDPCVYLVSPLNTPDRFLKGEYFLNSQQTHIKTEIMRKCCGLFGIKGSAGTGKTLLLYDIALKLGKTLKTCVVHSGILSDGHNYLAEHEDAFAVLSAKSINNDTFSAYDAICIDETQRLSAGALDRILEAYYDGKTRLCVFSYDYQQALSITEIRRNNPQRLNDLADFKEYALTDKIRTNDEISSFIRTMLHLYDVPRKQISYDRIDVVYANDEQELGAILRLYISKGYKYIMPSPSGKDEDRIGDYPSSANSHLVIGQEYDQVVVVMDNTFRYDEQGELIARKHPDPDYLFQRLFYQNITRARKRLCLAVYRNPQLLACLLGIKNYTLNYKKPVS